MLTLNRIKIAIVGDDISAFHLFNTMYRSDDKYEVVCFFSIHRQYEIDSSSKLLTYPPQLSGDLYPSGIPINRSFPYLKIDGLEKVIFSPSCITTCQYFYLAAQFMALNCSIVSHNIDITRLQAPTALVSFYSDTQFDIPILMKMIEIYNNILGRRQSTKKKKLAVVMPGPIRFLAKTNSEIDYFIIINSTKMFQSIEMFFNIHEKRMCKEILSKNIPIYFVYDFEQFTSEIYKKDPFQMIIFVGFNSLPSFFQPDKSVYVCDDFTFGDDISEHPSSIILEQSHLIIYAHLGSEDTSKRIEEYIFNKVGEVPNQHKRRGLSLNDEDDAKKAPPKNKNLVLEQSRSSDTSYKLVCCSVSSSYKIISKKTDGMFSFENKTALLFDDNYPVFQCNASKSISEHMANTFNIQIFKLDPKKPSSKQDFPIFGETDKQDWPACPYPEYESDIKNFHLIKNNKYNLILSSTTPDFAIKIPEQVDVMQFSFTLKLNNLTNELFELPPAAFIKRMRK